MKSGVIPVVGFGHKVAEGVPEDVIADHARAELPSMIIMGTRGMEKKEAEMIGSVTAEVLDEGRFMVLTVPEPLGVEQSLKPANILFFSNLDQDDILAMDALYRLFGDCKAKVTIIHTPKRSRFSDSSAGKALQRLGEYCRENFSQYCFVTVPVSRSDGDKEFAALQQNHNFDLVVVPNRRRNAFSRLFNPGLAHKLLFRTDIPMLVIPV